MHCICQKNHAWTKFIVITGGPGAGKTAVLELARRELCQHVTIIPEAASLMLGIGFFNRKHIDHIKPLQRSIFHLQKELEGMVEANTAIMLCDRGTLDGLAYWPGNEEDFWQSVQSSREIELARYHVVIHLRTPPLSNGYNHQNPHRIETAEQAHMIDEKILKAWEGHPKRFIIDNTDDFLSKAKTAIDIIKNELPHCCRS